MRSTLKIKTRLMLTAGAVALLMAAVATAALWSVREVHQHLETSLQTNARIATSSAQFARLAANLGRQGQATLSAAAGAGYQKELERWTNMDAAASAGLAVLEEIEAGRTAAAPLRASLSEYERHFRAALEQARGGVVNAELESRAEAALNRLDSQAADTTSNTANSAKLEAEKLDTLLTRARVGIIIALVVALVALALAVRFFVYRPLAAEASVIQEVCAALERGDLSSRVPAPTDSELGAIGRSLNLMLDNTMSLVQSRAERDQMQASIMKLLEEISGVAEGDLTVQAEVTTDVTGAVADSFNFMIAELRRVIGEVQNASRQVSTELAELRSITNELATGSEEQAAQAVDASVAIEEMAASIHYVSENASVSATVAETEAFSET